MIGRIINKRYQVIGEIGQGGMATVYQAKDLQDDRIVAVKVLRKEYLKDSKFLQRFQREAEASLHLKHCNIVKAVDVGQQDDIRYIVMEYIDGITLKEYIKQKERIPFEEAVTIAISIASALRHAHIHGIIHRDIKPQNILISKDKMVKVADFGIARASSTSTLTLGDTGVLGSVHYFSPEQARGKQVDAKSDIYSLGIVLYEMMTGFLPFEGDSVVEIALKHVEQDIEITDSAAQYIPANIWDILKKSTERSLTSRYESASSLIADLKKAKKEASPLLYEVVEEKNDLEKTKRIPVVGQIETETMNGPSKTTKLSPKSLSLLIGAGILVVIVSLAIVIAVFTNNFSGLKLTMPTLVGMDIDQAEALAEEVGLKIQIISRQHSDEPQDIVLSQIPESGESVRRGTEVFVVVSEGVKVLSMINCVGMSEENARLDLENQGFKKINVNYEYHQSEEGTVFEQLPENQKAVSLDAEIILTVSLGMDNQEHIVENYTNLEEETVKNSIESNGFVIGEIYREYSDTIGAGKVIKQYPEAGNTAEIGSAVNIWVSLGVQQTVEKKIAVNLAASDTSDPLDVRIVGFQEGTADKILYTGIHRATEGVFEISLRGSGIMEYTVFINDRETESGTINFYE